MARPLPAQRAAQRSLDNPNRSQKAFKVLRQPFAAQSPSIMPVFQQQPTPSQRSKPNPAPKRVQGRQGQAAAAAAAAAMMLACSVAAAHAAQQVAGSYSMGTWSTAALSVARWSLRHAATSLPNLGVAIFAGGSCTGFHVCFEISNHFVIIHYVII